MTAAGKWSCANWHAQSAAEDEWRDAEVNFAFFKGGGVYVVGRRLFVAEADACQQLQEFRVYRLHSRLLADDDQNISPRVADLRQGDSQGRAVGVDDLLPVAVRQWRVSFAQQRPRADLQARQGARDGGVL